MAKWIESTECIRFEIADHLARITLNRPDKRNTLTPQTLAELHAALLEADDRTDVNAIVLAVPARTSARATTWPARMRGKARARVRPTAASTALSTTTPGSSSRRRSTPSRCSTCTSR